MKRITLFLCVGALVNVALVCRSHGISFTDEAAWRVAVGGMFDLETFDLIADGADISQLPNLGVSFDPLNDGSQPTVQSYSNTGGVPKSQPHNLLNDRDFTLPGRGPYNLRPINITDLLFGVGLWNVGGDDQLRMTFYDADSNPIEQVTSASSFGFFGIVNPAGAKRVEIDFVGGNGYTPVDDLQTAVRPTFDVADPGSTLMLLGLSLGSLVALRRRTA